MAWYDNINRRGYQNYDGAQEYNPNFGKSFAGVGRFDPRNMMRPDNLSQDLGASTYTGPQAPQNPIFDPAQGNRGFMEEPSGVGEGYDKGRFRDVIGDKISGFTANLNPLGIVNTLTRRKGADQSFGGYPGGQFSRAGLFPQEVSNLQAVADAGYLGNQGQDVFGTNIVSQFGNYNKAMDKNLGVFKETMGKKGYSDLDELEKYYLDQYGDKSYILNKLRHVRGMTGQPTEIIQDKITTDVVPAGTTGGAITPGASERARQGGYNPSARSFRSAPGGLSQAQSRAARGDPTGTGGGWKWAEGGRVGYQGGELVEDEYMAEATPQGMMEENIEEVQGEPSREQLEAIALEIFRLPLEQLNEQQLEVVYQAAMEQEPSEEEVQFAAQEGPGEGIASLV